MLSPKRMPAPREAAASTRRLLAHGMQKQAQQPLKQTPSNCKVQAADRGEPGEADEVWRWHVQTHSPQELNGRWHVARRTHTCGRQKAKRLSFPRLKGAHGGHAESACVGMSLCGVLSLPRFDRNDNGLRLVVGIGSDRFAFGVASRRERLP